MTVVKLSLGQYKTQTCGAGPIGPIPRGAFILCIGARFGWPDQIITPLKFDRPAHQNEMTMLN